ncbi:hypothetical protein L5515_002840 [Caenorhabditis briggsae]|uniref:Protection of telomeres protein 1 ssDNA-binding domain-containing protein n=2 Tax=Caenorhabditis briggsae TaxID=6238 RepID=A0AAE9J5X2_CAEBR|nr:hypothetical protein L5515_002840 [Caenorhabditis briggsae]
MSKLLEERLNACAKFDDNKYYTEFQSYYNIVAQVHSVVLTVRNVYVLRVWRGSSFGPKHLKERREAQMFHIDKEMFGSYIVPPDIQVMRIIERFGKSDLIEIVVYDDHIETVKKLKSLDFVAIKNVHAYVKGDNLTMTLHGGNGGKHDRGIWVVPENSVNLNFQRMKTQCAEWLLIVQSDPNEYRKFGISDSDESNSDVTLIQKDLDENQIAKACNKIVIGDHISVDYFQQSSKCNYHFLTHAHSEHCRGINAKFPHKVYCSKETAKILNLIVGEPLPEDTIQPLDLNIPYKFENFQVTAIDANHCPGAVMFVFQGPLIDEIAGGPILCTGDFRAEASYMRQFENEKLGWVKDISFARIYLDNTYFSVDVAFTSREISEQLLQKEIMNHPDADIVLPLHQLGQERIIENLSYRIYEPIFVYPEKLAIGKVLGFFYEYGIANQKRQIQVVEKREWTMPDALGKPIIVIEVTQVDHLYGGASESDPNIRVPCSDHSSREEILKFLECFQFNEIYPTSKSYSKAEFKTMMQAGKTFTEKNLEKQLELHSFVEKTPEIRIPGRFHRSDYPEGEWRDDQEEYMVGDLDEWEEGPPETVPEPMVRRKNLKRRRIKSI